MIEEFLEKLKTSPVTFFPVRHHSPACAFHLKQTVLNLKPRIILIEGPENFSSIIPFLVHPELNPPAAIFTTFIHKTGSQAQPDRHGAYYPFCHYSSELVALQTGHKINAELRFIDLTYPDHILSDETIKDKEMSWKTFSLLEEFHLEKSGYIQHLVKRTGCRNHDELWDHLFEIHAQKMTGDEFITQLAMHCYFARLDYEPKILELDGTLARERMMASHIRDELNKNKELNIDKPILVVTGGFHTPGLLDLIDTDFKTPKRASISKEESQSTLIRFSYDQLDALNGYGAGMPSPKYYDMVWQGIIENKPRPFYDTISQLIVDIGRMTREKKIPNLLSPADEIEALSQACGLALLRGHEEPTREDLLDAIRSCFVKGSMDTEGLALMNMVYLSLRGDKVGNIPPGTGVPPIVDDFHRTARLLRLNLQTTERHELTLDLYRKPAHRRISHFLHSLEFLKIPFAAFTAGPDFINNHSTHLLRETWMYSWSPQTDSEIIKCSLYGSTIREASIASLTENMSTLEKEGKGRNAFQSIKFLISALLMGLHEQLEPIIGELTAGIAEDPDFSSLVLTMDRFLLLEQAAEPLQAHSLTGLPSLIQSSFQRVCYLVEELHLTPSDRVLTIVDHLNLASVLLTSNQPKEKILDSSLFYGSLEKLVGKKCSDTAITGAAAGILYRGLRLSPDQLLQIVKGILTGIQSSKENKTGVIYGLMQTCRELLWQQKWFLEAIDDLLQSWDEETFINNLPQMRLAFANLTPGETDRVAQSAASLYGKKDLGNLIMRNITAEEIQVNLLVNKIVEETLKKDHIDNLL